MQDFISQNSDAAPLWWIMFWYEYLKWPILRLNIQSPKYNFLSGNISHANISYFGQTWGKAAQMRETRQQNWATFLCYLRCWPSLHEEPCHARRNKFPGKIPFTLKKLGAQTSPQSFASMNHFKVFFSNLADISKLNFTHNHKKKLSFREFSLTLWLHTIHFLEYSKTSPSSPSRSGDPPSISGTESRIIDPLVPKRPEKNSKNKKNYT